MTVYQILTAHWISRFNKEVDICYKATNVEKKRSPYNFATPEQKAKIGKYAAENGTTNAIRHALFERIS